MSSSTSPPLSNKKKAAVVKNRKRNQLDTDIQSLVSTAISNTNDYQKKEAELYSDVRHVLEKPDFYIGPTHREEWPLFVPVCGDSSSSVAKKKDDDEESAATEVTAMEIDEDDDLKSDSVMSVVSSSAAADDSRKAEIIRKRKETKAKKDAERPVFQLLVVLMAKGLWKIVDEIMVNTIDRDEASPISDRLRNISVNVGNFSPQDPMIKKMVDAYIEHAPEEKNILPREVLLERFAAQCISIENDGAGIPIDYVEEVKEDGTREKWLRPVAFLSRLKSTDNNTKKDGAKKRTGGRFGIGGKATNIFSSAFYVETNDGELKLHYHQVFCHNNMQWSNPTVKKSTSKRGKTRIAFVPDLGRFEMDPADLDEFRKYVVPVVKARTYDACACTGPQVKVSFNGEQIDAKSFLNYAAMYQMDKGAIAHDAVNEFREGMPQYLEGKSKKRVNPDAVRTLFEVCAMRSEVHHVSSDGGSGGCVGFVNGVRCARGLFIDYAWDKIWDYVKDQVEKKNSKLAGKVTKASLKKSLFLVVKASLEEPEYDGPLKECQTKPLRKDFGFSWKPSPEFCRALDRTGVVKSLLEHAELAQKLEIMQKVGGTGSARGSSSVDNIVKYDGATKAGKKGHTNWLILTEGKSANAMADAGRTVVGSENYGLYPLRGKMLNVREASENQILENEEVNDVLRILGVKWGQKIEKLSDMRYQKILIFADQDSDGAHIVGLVMNFFHVALRSVFDIDPDFVYRFSSTMIAATNKKNKDDSHEFKSRAAYLEWMRDNELDEALVKKNFTVKFYKGLGTSDKKEAKKYFRDIEKNIIALRYTGEESERAIASLFAEKVGDEKIKGAEVRKDLLRNTYDRNAYIDYDRTWVSWEEYLYTETLDFSNYDNERNIPQFYGQKIGQRKILDYVLKKKCKKSYKVFQIGAKVAEAQNYHHGDASMNGTVVGLAQNHVGTNNINLLRPEGQFGSRKFKPTDGVASPRYIFTGLEPIALYIFRPEDSAVLDLDRVEEEGQIIEPRRLLPILPMTLVNGADGIGTGWSTTIPMYNPVDIVNATKMEIDRYEALQGRDDTSPGELNYSLVPWYDGFNGTIKPHPTKKGAFEMKGIYNVDREKGIVTVEEVPVGVWGEIYKQHLMTKHKIGYVDSESKKKKTKKTNDGDDQNVLKKRKGKGKGKKKDDDGSSGGSPGYEKERFILDIDMAPVDNNIHVVLKCDKERLERQINKDLLEASLNISTVINTSNMCLWDENNNIHKYSSAEEIVRDFVRYRHGYYEKRKALELEKLERDALIASNRKRFVRELAIDETLVVRKRKKADIVRELREKNYDPMPNKKKGPSEQLENDEENENEEDEEKEGDEGENAKEKDEENNEDFKYLYGMDILSMSEEKYKKLCDELVKINEKIQKLKDTTVYSIWRAELDEFLVEYEKFKVRKKSALEDAAESYAKDPEGKGKGGKRGGGGKKRARDE